MPSRLYLDEIAERIKNMTDEEVEVVQDYVTALLAESAVDNNTAGQVKETAQEPGAK